MFRPAGQMKSLPKKTNQTRVRGRKTARLQDSSSVVLMRSTTRPRVLCRRPPDLHNKSQAVLVVVSTPFLKRPQTPTR